jgi:hypothetical protein
MSGHGIHVHGAHGHAVEHAAHKGGLAQRIAIERRLPGAAAVSAFAGALPGIVAWA